MSERIPNEVLDTSSGDSLNKGLTKKEVIEQMEKLKQCKENAKAAQEEESLENKADLESDLNETLRSCEDNFMDGIENAAKD